MPSTGGQDFNKWHANRHEATGLPWSDDPEGQTITMTLNCDAGNLLRFGDLRGYNSLARMYTVEYATPA